jgi:hypothetical protein
MLVTTQETFERVLRSRSLILNNDPSKRSSKNRISTTKMLDLTPAGIRLALFELNSEDLHPVDRSPIGYLPSKRLALKAALKDWEVYRSGQPQLDRKAPPMGQWAERINRVRAQIAVGEAESRKLHELLAIHEAQKPVEPGARQKAAQKGHIKFRDGKYWKIAGREVTQDEKGVDIFADDGSLVSAYLAGLKKKPG